MEENKDNLGKVGFFLSLAPWAALALMFILSPG